MLKLMPCLFGDKLWGSSMGTGAYCVDAVLLLRCQVSGRLFPACSADWVMVNLDTLLVPHC